MEKKIRVLMVEPHKEPYPAEIDGTLEGMQSAVGGLIEPIDLEKSVTLVCNEEAKLIGLEGNRSLGNDIIAGTFFIAGSDEEGNLTSLSADKIKQYTEKFQAPETFTPEEIENTTGIWFIGL